MQYSKIFLVGLTALLLSACGGSGNSTSQTQSPSPETPTTPTPSTPDDGEDNDQENCTGSDCSEPEEPSSPTPDPTDPDSIPEPELCELPSDDLTENIYSGLDTKNAYTLGAPNNYIEENSGTDGTDLTGTWTLISKTTEQQFGYSRIIYQKSFFIIKKDSGKYLAANCRAAHSEPVYKEQWFNKIGNPVYANCLDFPLINGQPSPLAPDGCLNKDANGAIIGLLDIQNPEAVTKKLIADGSVATPWTGFITATYLNDGSQELIELPFTHPADLSSDKESLSFKLKGNTHSHLTAGSSSESASKVIESSFEAIKLSKTTDALGSSYIQYDTDGTVIHTDNNSDIYCITQQFVIERQSCATPNTVPSFTITTNTHQHRVAAMKAETLSGNLHLAISEFEESGVYKTVQTGALDIPEKDWHTEAELDSSTEFKPNQIDFKLTLKNTTEPDNSTPENPVPPIVKSAVYEFHATIPDTTTP